MGLLDFLKGKQKLTPAEQEFVRKQQKKLAKELQTMLHTDDLKKFMGSLRNAKLVVDEIGQTVGWDTVCIAGGTPQECMDSLYRDVDRPMKECIHNYIQSETVRIMGLSRSRLKTAQGVSGIIDVYAADMPSDCAEYAKQEAAAMIEKIKQLEA